MTSKSAVKDAIRLIKLEKMCEITKRYFGTYTFLINDALDTMDDIELVVASEKKLKINCPLKI